MANLLGFVFFSVFEGLTVLSLAMYVFRIDFMKYIGPALAFIIVTNAQNYIVREELSLAWIAPIINLIITAIFFFAVIRLPIVWGLILSISGYIGLGIIQTAIINFSFGYFSISQANENIWKMYLIQMITGFIGFGCGWLLYKFGLGFTFDFEKIRLKSERVIVSVVIASFIATLGITIYFRDIYLNLLIHAAALPILLLYSFKKEGAEG